MITKFLNIPTDEKLLLIEAVMLLYVSKIMVFFPFKQYVRLLHSSKDKNAVINSGLHRKISISVKRANKIAIWKNICLVQSVAACLMLKRRRINYNFSLGLQFRDGTKLVAHAWVKSGNFFVTPRGNEDFKEIFMI